MLPPERRLPGVRRLIDQRHYFVLHAPRQSGKTTYLRSLAPALTADGRYAALVVSCEVGQAAEGNVERGIAALLDAIRQAADSHLPEDLRPPKADPGVPAETRLLDLLSRWSRQCPRPVVLFLDEIDSLLGFVLISVLRQLRSGYPERPGAFPQSVALVGLRDVRRSYPFFNITTESLELPGFSLDEVANLYRQNTKEVGQAFTAEAVSFAFGLTDGHPWLVNALARQSMEVVAPDPPMPITPEIVEVAKEKLIQRGGPHFDSLIGKLRESRVRRVIEQILAGGTLSPEVMEDDIQLALDLGLVKIDAGNLAIANPIYREVIPQALTNTCCGA